MTEANRRAADASIQASTVAWLRATQPTLCAAYAPIGPEPGGPDLPERLTRALFPPQATSPSPPGPPAPAVLLPVLLPVLHPDGDLDWALHDGSLQPATRGLREPSGPRLGPEAIARADLVIVPALAVDRHTGVRMGRGGGSYDRALARLTPSTPPSPRAFVIALLYDGELVDDLPHEPHDRPVDAVITPSEGLVHLTPDALRQLPGWTK